MCAAASGTAGPAAAVAQVIDPEQLEVEEHVNDVTGLAVALTGTARTRAHQLARDLQAAHRRLNTAGANLTAARQAYARAADDYRALHAQATAVWTADELTAAGAAPPPVRPSSRRRADS